LIFEIEVANKRIAVQLENKKHIRHCYLRVLKEDLIQIRANKYFDIYDAHELLNRKKDWIEKSIKQLEKKRINDDEFLYLGQVEKLVDYKIKDIDKFYKKEIEKHIYPLIEKHSKNMNLFPTSIRFRKNKRTWGSCNYKNGLNFNYLLMKYPIHIMEYIVIHELAHIKHKNHSKKFWDLVEKYCPNYKFIEKEFKTLL
jgi:predicted metal-dependent hydrolase